MSDYNSNISIMQKLIKGGRINTALKVYSQFLSLWKKKKLGGAGVSDLVETIGPKFTFVSFSKGGIKYQVPQLLKDKKSKSIALKWLINQHKKGLPSSFVYLSTLLEVKEGKGVLLKRRDEVHKLALLNQRFFRFMRIKRLRLNRVKKRR